MLADVASKELELREDTLELINSEIAGRLVRQADSSAKIDSKATALTGYALAAASFLATRHVQPVLAGLAYGTFAVAAVLSVAASAVGSHTDVPESRPLFNKYATRTRAETLAALGATRVRTFEENARRHARKGRLWLAAVGNLGAGVVLMISAILMEN